MVPLSRQGSVLSFFPGHRLVEQTIKLSPYQFVDPLRVGHSLFRSSFAGFSPITRIPALDRPLRQCFEVDASKSLRPCAQQ